MSRSAPLAALEMLVAHDVAVGRDGICEMCRCDPQGVLEEGDKIKIAGFGNFVVKEKSDRRGRNPQTGEEITIVARKILTFKPSQVLKSAINNSQ